MSKKRIQDMTIEEKWEEIEDMMIEDSKINYNTEEDFTNDYASNTDYNNRNYTEL